jgi:hypothetical protein
MDWDKDSPVLPDEPAAGRTGALAQPGYQGPGLTIGEAVAETAGGLPGVTIPDPVGGPPVVSPAGPADEVSEADGAGLRDLERRLDRLSALAEARHEEHGRLRQERAAAAGFLALAPRAVDLMDELSRALFGEILDEVEANLSHAIREILGQDRQVRSVREFKNNRLNIDFEIVHSGQVEDILSGQGGSVCNILSVSLRLIALSQLDPASHRPFLVLDEQDCWLKPELVPKFMKLVAAIAKKLGLQVLVISHHPIDLFSCHAERIYTLRPGQSGAVLELLKSGCDEPAPDLPIWDDPSAA